MDAPPSYDKAVAQPQVNVTAPQDNLSRQRSNASTASTTSEPDVTHLAPGMTEDGRRSMDDERRELPEGWVRCFDPKQEHHFYVDTATKRSTWVHPYDDPEYLAALPDTHPANPRSPEAQQIVRRAEEEQQRRKDKASGRNWFQRKKDDIIGTKEERTRAKEEKRRRRAEEEKRMMKAQQEYMKRRRELLQRQLNDPSIRSYYASNPYGYSAPLSPYGRMGYGGLGGYGYGYPGGYGRRYGGYGYGGGMGMPLFGGLAGGMLLGSAMCKSSHDEADVSRWDWRVRWVRWWLWGRLWRRRHGRWWGYGRWWGRWRGYVAMYPYRAQVIMSFGQIRSDDSSTHLSTYTLHNHHAQSSYRPGPAAIMSGILCRGHALGSSASCASIEPEPSSCPERRRSMGPKG